MGLQSNKKGRVEGEGEGREKCGREGEGRVKCGREVEGEGEGREE